MRNLTWKTLLVFLGLGVAAAWAAGRGELDATFDSDGVVEAEGVAWVSATAVQSGGRVLVAGQPHWSAIDAGAESWVIRGYTTAGVPDAGFGSSGEVALFAGVGGLTDMLLDGSGRILASGVAPVETQVLTGKGKNKTWTTVTVQRSVVVRLSASGVLDAGFGDGGVAVLEGAEPRGPGGTVLGLQSDGSIVVVGTRQASSGGGGRKKGASTPPNNVVFVARLDTDGALDSSFGTDGYASNDLGPARAVAIQTDDAIVVGGSAGDATDSASWALHRYDADGALDTTFGTVLAPAGAWHVLHDLAVDPSDRILAGGYANTGGVSDGVVVRYGADGDLDTTFGSGGSAYAGISTRNESRRGLGLRADGTIVLAGTIVHVSPSYAPEAYVVAFDADGVLDTAFGTLGHGAALPLADPQVAMAVAVTSTGDILVAGIIERDITDDAEREMFLARWGG